MATTTLTNGTKIPERASRDWYSDLSVNWNLIDNHLGDTDSHLDDGLAPKATADADGNTITSTYATKTELSTLSDTVSTKANDADVVHKADAETITGAKTFSATVTSADVVPSATDTYSLGSASYQYNGIYSKSYFYNGVQWGLDVANTWTNYQTIQGAYLGNEHSGNARTNLYLLANRDTEGQSGIYVRTFRQNREQGGMTSSDRSMFGIDVLENGTRTTGLSCHFTDWANDAPGTTMLNASTENFEIRPTSINGINPGSLSLPNFDSYSVITSDFTANLDKTQTSFSWTSQYTGWLHVMWLTRDATEPYYVYVWANASGGTGLSNSIFGQVFSQASAAWWFPIYFPVVAGHTYYFERNWVRSTNDSTTRSIVSYAVFIPTLGNV